MSEAVHVLADGWELTGTGRFGGIGSLSRNLYRALAERTDVDLSVLAVDPDVVPEPAVALPMRRRWNERRRSLYEHEALISVTVRRHPSDVVYSPVLHGIPSPGRPYVQTLHDVIPVARPEPGLGMQRKWWRRWARAYRRADTVVAVSRYSADEGIRLLGLDPARVEVVHNGVDAHCSPRPSAEPDDPPYLLLVSEYSARKGFPDAFAVVGALAEGGYPHRLEVAGRVMPQFATEVERLVAAAPASDRVMVRGFVDDLAELYRGASVFVWPSRYEGFGLPVIEAMASGVPVVAYANSSIPEVVGDAGVLVPDGDVDALAKAVRSVIDSPARWAELREAGLARARRFTWAAAAQGYAEVFHRVAGR